jgi:nucleoside-diphosphate-sugar epimerase
MSVALVTGATGLIGSHIVDRLLAGGWSVRALVRTPERAWEALPSAVEIVHGDVLDEASMVRAATGCHALFHAAAHVAASGGWEAYRATNVQGTQNALAAAERANARMLHVSSVAVYGPAARYEAAKRGQRTDETARLAPLSDHAYYPRSKRESEQAVLRAHTEGRVWATVVRPSVVYGRRDRQFVPRMAVLIERGAVPLLRGGRSIMSVVHAENVAAGAVLAATSDIAGGKTYNLANDFDVSVRRFFDLAGEGLDKQPRWIPMPLWLARALLLASKWLTRFVSGGRFRGFASSAVDFISQDNPFSSDRAKRELGWSPLLRPEIGVPDAFRWWKENRYRQKGRDIESRP